MKNLEHFRVFLKDTVNLKPSKKQSLDERMPILSGVIKGAIRDTTVLDAIPQGSWAHRTIIEPGEGLEFDADFLLQLDEVAGWSPSKYNQVVWDVLHDHGTYGSMTTRKNRCIRVTYANDYHVDVVPYVVLTDGREVIVNRTTDSFEDTNPIGFTEWLQEKDRITGGDLRKVIRLMKYLRDHRGTFTIKSVLLTTLLGERVDQWRSDSDPEYYADAPTTLLHVVQDLDTWLQARPTKAFASISDPSCPTTTFDHRWTDNQYVAFRSAIHSLAADIEEAYNSGVTESVPAWQAMFGPAFKTQSQTASATESEARSASTSGYVARDRRVPGEQFIDDRFALDPHHWVHVEVEVSDSPLYNRRQRRSVLRARAHHVAPGRRLTFRIIGTDVPEPYEIWWKVRNRGEEAGRRSCERGAVFKGGAEHEEPTSFKGPHYVECYIVKDRVCVAVRHLPVSILFNK